MSTHITCYIEIESLDLFWHLFPVSKECSNNSHCTTFDFVVLYKFSLADIFDFQTNRLCLASRHIKMQK